MRLEQAYPDYNIHGTAVVAMGVDELIDIKLIMEGSNSEGLSPELLKSREKIIHQLGQISSSANNSIDRQINRIPSSQTAEEQSPDGLYGRVRRFFTEP